MAKPGYCFEMKSAFVPLLAQATCYKAALQLTGVLTVLPYIAAEIGAPAIAVALLVPAFFAGSLCGTVYAAKILRWVASATVLLAGIAVLQALLTVANASGITFLPLSFSVYLIIVTAGIIGVVSGFAIVGFPLAISALLSAERRSDLVLRRSAFAAVVVIAASAYSRYFLADGSPLDDVIMLWLGALVMAVAALATVALGRPTKLSQAISTPLRTTMADGFAYLRQHPWFRRYILTQLIFTAVTLGPLFYGIYISTTLGPFNGCLDGILVFIGIGLLAGTVVWTIVRKRFGTSGMYVGSAAMSFAAATLCVVSLAFDLMHPMLTFELVILLAAMANQAVYPAALDWIYRETTEDVRVLVITFSQVFVTIAVMLISFILGLVAAQAPALWPLAIIVSGAAIAALAATRVPRMERAN